MDRRRLLFIAGIISLLVGLAAVLGSARVPPAQIIASMLSTTLAVATPLTLGALCGVWCERAGVVNIGIEGTMLTSAFFGWTAATALATFTTAPAGLCLLGGVGAAVLSAMLVGLLLSVLAVTFRVDQIIAGVVVDLFAVGVTGFLNRQMMFDNGGLFGGTVPHSAGVLPHVRIPGLADLPVIGSIFDQQPIAFAGLLLVGATHYVLFFTRFGLRVRAAGEHPRAAATVGIDVRRIRHRAVLIGSAIAGLGGAYFTLESVPSFEPLMTNGRGFIALAAMIFGNWTPIGALGAALLFGSAQALQINLQFFREAIPESLSFLQQSSIVGLLPYVLTMVVLTGLVGRTTPPAADGNPDDGRTSP